MAGDHPTLRASHYKNLFIYLLFLVYVRCKHGLLLEDIVGVMIFFKMTGINKAMWARGCHACLCVLYRLNLIDFSAETLFVVARRKRHQAG